MSKLYPVFWRWGSLLRRGSISIRGGAFLLEHIPVLWICCLLQLLDSGDAFHLKEGSTSTKREMHLI